MLSPALQLGTHPPPLLRCFFQPLQKSQLVTFPCKLLDRAVDTLLYSPTSSNSIFLFSCYSLLSTPKTSSCSRPHWTRLFFLLLDDIHTALSPNFPLFFLYAGLYRGLPLRDNYSLAISFSLFLHEHPLGIQQVDKSSTWNIWVTFLILYSYSPGQ